VPQVRHHATVSAAAAGLNGLIQPLNTAVAQCGQSGSGVVNQAAGGMCQTFTFVSQPSYTFVPTPLVGSTLSAIMLVCGILLSADYLVCNVITIKYVAFCKPVSKGSAKTA
jgi:hypothetical protein